MADYAVAAMIDGAKTVQVVLYGERNSATEERPYSASPNIRPFYSRGYIRPSRAVSTVTEASGNKVIMSEVKPRTL